MKLNFNTPLKNLDNVPQEDGNGNKITIGKLLANELSQAREGDAVKFWDWALKLHRGETIDLDKSDQGTMKEFIKGSKTMFVILKAQLLEVFEKAENSSKLKAVNE